jgi:hypothetical protein
MGFWASDRKTPAAQSLYRSIFLDDQILHCLCYESYPYTVPSVIQLNINELWS